MRMNRIALPLTVLVALVASSALSTTSAPADVPTRIHVQGSLLSSGGMQEVVSDIAETQVAKQQLANVPDTRAERVDEARERVDSGFYDRPQIRQDTADRILDEMA